jgi:YggT family protein
MNPFTYIVLTVIDLYSKAILVWFILSLLIYFKVVNRSHPIVYKVDEFLSRLIEPLLKPIRKYLPPVAGIDLSPLVLILGLSFLQQAIVYYF